MLFYTLLAAFSTAPVESATSRLEDDCGINLVPLYILAAVLGVFMLLILVLSRFDQIESIKYGRYSHLAVPQDSPGVSFNSERLSNAMPRELEVIQLELPIEDVKIGQRYSPEVSCVTRWLKGHLTLGLWTYREDYSRVFRVFTMLILWVSHLIVIGLIFVVMKDTDTGKTMTAKELFENYELEYLLYGTADLCISIVLAVILIYVLSSTEGKSSKIFIFCTALGTAVIVAGIVGTVFIVFDFCHQWGGYWAITYLYAILSQIFVLETVYMIVRACFDRAVGSKH